MVNLMKALKELTCIHNNTVVGYYYVIEDNDTPMLDIPIYTYIRAKCVKCGKERNHSIGDVCVPFTEIMVDGFDKVVECRVEDLRGLGFVSLQKINRKQIFDGEMWVE